jgi:hypothetical protein
VDVPNFPKKTRFLPWKLCAIVDALFWRHRVLKAARDLNSKVEFDVVHHVSWSSLHVGSQLWKLGRPFVFGPIGGGQLAPGGFGHYLRGGWSEEFIRFLVVRYFTGTLLYAKSTVAHADLVLVANYETREWAERRNFEAPKSSPQEIVRTTLDALERGEGQVLADEITRQVHRDLSADLPAYFQSTAAFRSRAGLPSD